MQTADSVAERRRDDEEDERVRIESRSATRSYVTNGPTRQAVIPLLQLDRFRTTTKDCRPSKLCKACIKEHESENSKL